MREIGIMFSAPMVRAVDDDRKTQTRRLASSPLARLRPGTRLWVRETFSFDVAYDAAKPSLAPKRAAVFYEADGSVRGGGVKGKLRPAIHMPRFAARFGLQLESVRVEPLIEISYDDVLAEGCPVDPNYHDTTADGSCPHMVSTGVAQWQTPRLWYHRLWESLHTKPGERWEDNPDVVVLTFSKAWVDR